MHTIPKNVKNCFAVIFSYVFGGFGLDIAGHSILQINKFHIYIYINITKEYLNHI